MVFYHYHLFFTVREKNTENPCHNKTREVWFKQSVVSAGKAACQKVKPLIQTSVHKWHRSLFSCRFQKILPPFLEALRQHTIVRVLRCVLCSETGDKKGLGIKIGVFNLHILEKSVSIIAYDCSFLLQITCKEMHQCHEHTFALYVDTEGINHEVSIMQPKTRLNCEVICYRCLGGKPLFISLEDVLCFSSGFLFPYLLSSVSVCCVWQIC